MSYQEESNSNKMDNRPLEPDHPMVLEGGLVDGDLRLMVRCQLEDMLLIGTPPQVLLAMANDTSYQGLYAARQALGGTAFDKIFEDTLTRIGVHRASCRESAVLEYPESFIPFVCFNSMSCKEQDHA